MIIVKGNNVCEVATGDCVELLAALPDNCIPCCVTSPPYDKLRTYGGIKPFTFDDFMATAVELYRVMMAGGVVCWVVGDSVVDGSETVTSAQQKIFFRAIGFWIHDTMAYVKSNFSAPERVRYHQAWEYIFVLSKGAPRCFNPLKDRPNIYAGATTLGRRTKRQADGTQQLSGDSNKVIATHSMRMNFWQGNTAGQERPCQPIEHPAAMPEWLARDLLLSWSNHGDCILDPFGGRGTVGKMAMAQGRNALLFELNPQYAAQIPEYLER